MRNTIVYRHWQPGDDDAVLAFRPNTNQEYRESEFPPTGELDTSAVLFLFLDFPSFSC